MSALGDAARLESVLEWCLCIIWRSATTVAQAMSAEIGDSVTSNTAFSLVSLKVCIDKDGQIKVPDELTNKING
eukprot:5651442-Alexandrium_andersonii.AAC.1